MPNPVVSIIIPTYNYATFLPKAIESALTQTYSNIEVIVVNDGSTDETSEVVKPFLHQIKYCEQSNSGVVVARNNGAKQASGNYLLFLDADDYLTSTFVESCLKESQAEPNAAFIYTDRKIVGNGEFRHKSLHWNLYQLLLSNYIGLTSLIQRDAFEKIGGFRLSMNKSKSYEDWDLWLTFAENGYTGMYNSEVYYYHRKLNQGSRNDAGFLLKLRLRWQLMITHWRLYFPPTTWWKLSKIAVSTLRRKREFIRQTTT